MFLQVFVLYKRRIRIGKVLRIFKLFYERCCLFRYLFYRNTLILHIFKFHFSLHQSDLFILKKYKYTPIIRPFFRKVKKVL